MAALFAAGAASSCAGLILGSYAMKSKSSAPSAPQAALRGGSLPPARPFTRLYTAPASSSLNPVQQPLAQPILLPPPRAPLPGQCPLCHSWFQQGDVVAKLDCGHVNHKVCTEVVSRQPVYVGYRCTCAVCRGPALIVKFAVAEFVQPAPPQQQQQASFTTPPSSTPSFAPPEPPIAIIPVPPLPVASPAPAVVVEQKAPPLIAGGHTPFYLRTNRLQGGGPTSYPTCTLCDCMECRQGSSGSCPTCGKCLCSRCVQGECECGCVCTVDADSDPLRSTLSSLY